MGKRTIFDFELGQLDGGASGELPAKRTSRKKNGTTNRRTEVVLGPAIERGESDASSEPRKIASILRAVVAELHPEPLSAEADALVDMPLSPVEPAQDEPAPSSVSAEPSAQREPALPDEDADAHDAPVTPDDNAPEDPEDIVLELHFGIVDEEDSKGDTQLNKPTCQSCGKTGSPKFGTLVSFHNCTHEENMCEACAGSWIHKELKRTKNLREFAHPREDCEAILTYADLTNWCKNDKDFNT